MNKPERHIVCTGCGASVITRGPGVWCKECSKRRREVKSFLKSKGIPFNEELFNQWTLEPTGDCFFCGEVITRGKKGRRACDDCLNLIKNPPVKKVSYNCHDIQKAPIHKMEAMINNYERTMRI